MRAVSKLLFAAIAAVSLSLPVASTASADEAAPAQAALKVAVLDTQKVLRESEEGLRVEANLRKMFDQKQGEMVQREKQLSQEYEDLQKEEKSKGKSDALERKKNDFKQKYAAYQQSAMDLQREFARKQNELYSPMIQKIGNIVRNVVQKEGLDLVVEKQATVYFRNDLEITEKVIALYNAGETGTGKDGKSKPKPAPAKEAPKPAPKK